jgi:hypothetical protein
MSSHNWQPLVSGLTCRSEIHHVLLHKDVWYKNRPFLEFLSMKWPSPYYEAKMVIYISHSIGGLRYVTTIVKESET